jgi:hypothetical protein
MFTIPIVVDVLIWSPTMFFMRNYCTYLQVLCEAVQSREVNKSQLPRILNKIKLHISIEEQYTLSTQVLQSTSQENPPFCFLFFRGPLS